MNKLLTILLIFSFVFTQELCEGTCLSEEQAKEVFFGLKECEKDNSLNVKIIEKLDSQIYMYIQNEELLNSQIEDYKIQIKLKEDMIKVVKPKWYENKWIWFGLGVAFTSGSVYLGGQLD